MKLTVITPRGVLYNIQVDKASFPGVLGSFSVMHNHAPILSILRKGKIRYKVPGQTGEQEIAIENGVVEIKQNQIRIFTESSSR